MDSPWQLIKKTSRHFHYTHFANEDTSFEVVSHFLKATDRWLHPNFYSFCLQSPRSSHASGPHQNPGSWRMRSHFSLSRLPAHGMILLPQCRPRSVNTEWSEPSAIACTHDWCTGHIFLERINDRPSLGALTQPLHFMKTLDLGPVLTPGQPRLSFRRTCLSHEQQH